jgi:hypothetical protein
MVDLDGIGRRLALATPGPWQRHGADVYGADGSRLFVGRDGSAQVRAQADHDAELVAHAAQDLGALLDEVSRLREQLGQAGTGRV